MTLGTITLIGSGETASTGGQVFESLARGLPAPLTISILETPAGFETNARRVAGRVADFLSVRLQNDQPQIEIISARKKGTPLSPDAPDIVQPLYASQMIFFGPGSPTYTIRQLVDSLAWQIIQARQRLGASLVLASAATIAIGSLALPVYEIFKVGEEPHWKAGLDLFKPYGLDLVIIPHWNNREGGEEVDTSRCFIGRERFAQLMAQLPAESTLIGIDEHSALTIDLQQQTCLTYGQGEIHILRAGQQQDHPAGSQFSLSELGNAHPLAPETGLPEAVWKQALAAEQALQQQRQNSSPEAQSIPSEVQELANQRQQARLSRDWATADQLRGRLANLGWMVKDTPAGPELHINK